MGAKNNDQDSDFPRSADRARLAWGRIRNQAKRKPTAFPKISVVIPTYNRGQLLTERTLPSLLAETYPNFEVIVVGDCCTDDTTERIAALGVKRVRFYNLPQRGTYPSDPYDRWLVAGATPINKGLDIARGDWLAYMDDDDTVEPEHLSALMEHARQSDAEFVYGAGRFQRSPDEWLRIGGWPPRPGKVMHSSILYRGYLRFLKYDVESWRMNMATDAHLYKRMWDIGIRFSFLDRIVCASPLRPGDDLGGQRAAERARRKAAGDGWQPR